MFDQPPVGGIPLAPAGGEETSLLVGREAWEARNLSAVALFVVLGRLRREFVSHISILETGCACLGDIIRR